MIIRFALYKDDKTVQRIRPEDILSVEEYRSKFRNHLCCCEEGCDANIELAHRNGQPYFRTWRNSKHAEHCRFAFENDPTKVSMQAAETMMVRVSDKHKRKSLNYANKKRKQDEGVLPVTDRMGGRPRPNRPVTERDGIRLVASVDPNARMTTLREKEPPISTRKCTDITVDDVARYINVYGRVNKAAIKEDNVRFFFDTHGGPNVSVLFFNRFRDNSLQQYGWVERIARLIVEGHITNLPISCIGVCELKENRYDIQVMDEASISINDCALSVFMRDLNVA